MTTNKYALSHSERGWLIHSVAYLNASVIYGLISLSLLTDIANTTVAYGIFVAPIIFLFSLCLGFAFCTVGHYTVRVSKATSNKEDACTTY